MKTAFLSVVTVLLVFPTSVEARENAWFKSFDGIDKQVQTTALASMASRRGYKCIGSSIQFKGMNQDTGVVYHQVNCTNDNSYIISVDPEPNNFISIIDCKELTRLGSKVCNTSSTKWEGFGFGDYPEFEG